MESNSEPLAQDSQLGVPGLSGWPHSQFARRRLAIEFTGSGSEYFRIWIVNLALCLLTLGLYWPYAKARRLRYFYANTVVDGQALAFHGNPHLMFRGFLLLGSLTLAYGLAGRFAPLAAAPLLLLLVGLWPALFHAGQCFRMRNTSWRGLRFGFSGRRVDAYLALAPLLLPGLAFMGLTLYYQDELMRQTEPPASAVFGVLGSMLLFYLILPWAWTRLKRYQHAHYSYAGLHSEAQFGAGAVYKLCFKLLGVAVLGLVLLMVPIFVSGWLGQMLQQKWVVVGGMLLGYIGYFAAVVPFAQARSQNLVWSGTAAQGLQFESNLRWRDLALLNFQSWLLTALTLGLFRPFAAVNLARLRLEMVTLMVEGDPIDWVAQHRQSGALDASGDAAGDLFGFDVGL